MAIVPLATAKRKGLACLPRNADETPAELWFYATDNAVVLPPAAKGTVSGDVDRVFAVDGQAGDQGRRLHCLNGDGKMLWQRKVARRASGHVLLQTNCLIVDDRADAIGCVDLDGNERWSSNVARLAVPPIGEQGMLIVATADSNHLIALDGETGKQLWRRQLAAAVTGTPVVVAGGILVATGNDCTPRSLVDGNALFADGQIKEVNPKTNEIVWHYKPKEIRGGGAFACQRLSGGVTLVGENSTGRILEVDKDGRLVFQMPLQPYREGDHNNIRMVRKLKGGNYLVCLSGAHIVREYTPKGQIVFEVKVDNIAFSAVRLDNGNTLVGHIDHITEFNPRGEEVWKFSNQDIEGVVITWMCDVHVLPNGNIAVGVYSAYKNGEGNGLFEITRDKRLVWRYSNPDVDGNMMGIQVLDPDGKPLAGDPLR